MSSALLTALFRGESFVVLDKPAGWLSVPSRLGADDGRPCAGKAFEEVLGVRLWPVHRLDLEVTGLLLFATSAEAHRRANAWFEQRLVGKSYEALSEGEPPSEVQALWHSTLLRGKKRAYESPHGKASETSAHYLGTVSVDGAAALHWQLEPLTGRPHQLRFELMRHGYPILGDKLYSAKRPCPRRSAQVEAQDGIALRCVSLDFRRCPGAAELGLPAELKAPSLLAVLGVTASGPVVA